MVCFNRRRQLCPRLYGGAHKKKEKILQNRRVAQRLKTFLSYSFGEEEFHISRLSELVNIGRKSPSVITRLSEGRTWGTVRNYLHCYSHFLDFLESCVPAILDVTTINAMRMSLKGSIHTVTKLSQEQLQRRKLSDRHRLINWEDLCNYIDSHMALRYMQNADNAVMNELEQRKIAAQKVGSHLLLQIALQNGKRTGIYCDTTVREFHKAEKELGGYVVLIVEGKTFRVIGGAGIFFLKSEYNLMVDYIKEWRPLFNPKNEQIFCRPSGERSTVGDINAMLKSSWQDFGLEQKKNVGSISCCLIQKTLVSKARQTGIDRSEQEAMARHMDHSIGTADRHYDVNTGVKITARYREIIKRFRECEKEIDDTSSGDDEKEYIPPSQSTLAAKPLLFQTAKNVTEPKSLSQDISCFRFGRECIFSDEDTANLKRCCALVIRDGSQKKCTITKKMIIGATEAAGSNFGYLLEKFTSMQLCSKVRTEIRKETLRKSLLAETCL